MMQETPDATNATCLQTTAISDSHDSNQPLTNEADATAGDAALPLFQMKLSVRATATNEADANCW
jgi:hypothetical protein